MIKKYLLGIGIGLLTLIGFTSAYSYKQDFNIPDTFVKVGTTYLILNNFNFSTTYENTTINNVLLSQSNISSNGRNRLRSFFAWYNGKPYLYADYIHDGNRDYVYQGFPTQFCLATAGSGESVCVPSDWFCPKNTDIGVFYNAGKLTHGTYYGYGDFSSTYQSWTYCVSDDINDYCFSVNASSSYCGNGYLTDSLNVSGVSLDQLQSFNWSSSPFTPGYNDYQPGITEINPTDLDRYIEYYETRFGRDKNMCYVGTDDLSAVYGATGISFEVGSGKLIYELYSSLYNTFGSNKIKNVGSFVNTLLINYSQWFYDGKRYLVTYNGPDTNITVYYDNLEFPFGNKPVANFFLASNLFDNYSTESTQGDEIVFYCDLKTNYDFYKSKENEEDFQEVVDLVGSDVTDRIKTYYNTQISVGSGSVGFSVPDLSGSVWGNISSGNVLPKDLSPTNLFKDFFTKITNLTKSFTPNSNPLLPDWIVYPLIFLVLFRIFKH